MLKITQNSLKSHRNLKGLKTIENYSKLLKISQKWLKMLKRAQKYLKLLKMALKHSKCLKPLKTTQNHSK